MTDVENVTTTISCNNKVAAETGDRGCKIFKPIHRNREGELQHGCIVKYRDGLNEWDCLECTAVCSCRTSARQHQNKCHTKSVVKFIKPPIPLPKILPKGKGYTCIIFEGKVQFKCTELQNGIPCIYECNTRTKLCHHRANLHSESHRIPKRQVINQRKRHDTKLKIALEKAFVDKKKPSLQIRKDIAKDFNVTLDKIAGFYRNKLFCSSKPKFSSEQIDILENFYQSKKGVYPNKKDLKDLTTKTGLNEKQIQRWFYGLKLNRRNLINPEPINIHLQVEENEILELVPEAVNNNNNVIKSKCVQVIPLPPYYKAILEKVYENNNHPNPQVIDELASKHQMDREKTRVWFRSRNMKRKSKRNIMTTEEAMIMDHAFLYNPNPDKMALLELANKTNNTLTSIRRRLSYRRCGSRKIYVERTDLPDSPIVIQGSVRDPIPPLLNNSPRLFWADAENGPLEIKFKHLESDDFNNGKIYQIYWVPWKNVEGEIMGLAVSFTSRLDVREGALINWDHILTRGDNACSYRYWYHEFGWIPDCQAARSFGVYATNFLTAMILKWWYRLRLISIGTFMKRESIDQLHAYAGYLDETVWSFYDNYSEYTQEWLDMSQGNMTNHILNQDNKFPGIDQSLLSRIDFKKEHGFDPLRVE